MAQHLIDPCDVEKYARPCDCDDHIVVRAIEEAELLDIKPKIGDELFLRISEEPQAYDELLSGGQYEDCSGNERSFVGLKRTLAYYTWARLVKTAPNHLTRFGFVQKRDEHSAATEFRERQVAYNDAFAIADSYARQCIDYIQSDPGKFPEYGLKGRISANRTIFRIIGN